MILNNWKQKIVAKARINELLWCVKILRGSSRVFRQILGGNHFWETNFDEEELMMGRRMHGNFVFSAQELGQLAEDARDNLERDINKLLQIIDDRTEPTSGLNATLAHHTPENKAALELLQQWGERDAGLKQIYQTDNDTVRLIFDSEEWYQREEEIDARDPNFITQIVNVIREHQLTFMTKNSRHELTNEYLKNVQTAVDCGLPSNYESAFSHLDACYIDCFVLNQNGILREADAVVNQDGRQQQYDTDALYGAKHWCQIFKDELVVKFIREQKVVDEKVYYSYEYLVVVAPEQLTAKQEKALAELADLFWQESNESNSVMANPRLFTWEYPYSRIFETDERFSLIPETFKEIKPEYCEMSSQFWHCTEEEVIHIMNDQGEIVCPTANGNDEAANDQNAENALINGQNFAEFAQEIAGGDEEDEDGDVLQQMLKKGTTAEEILNGVDTAPDEQSTGE